MRHNYFIDVALMVSFYEHQLSFPDSATNSTLKHYWPTSMQSLFTNIGTFKALTGTSIHPQTTVYVLQA